MRTTGQSPLDQGSHTGKSGAPVEPETVGAGGRITYAQLLRYLEVAERSFWTWTSKFNNLESQRLSGPEPWRWYWKPRGVTLGFMLAALAMFVGQFFVPFLGAKLHSTSILDYSGFYRLAMLLIGFILTSLVAPSYRPVGWSPQDDEKNADAHDDFQRKFHR